MDDFGDSFELSEKKIGLEGLESFITGPDNSPVVSRPEGRRTQVLSLNVLIAAAGGKAD